jgi:hypothetical protein
MDKDQLQIIRTARVTGIWYLLLAISGIVGFMIFHSKIYISGNPEATLNNLTDQESLARIRLLLEFAIILSQALAAAWFYKLFKPIDEWASWILGIWGMINAVAIMISAISMASAIEVAHSSAYPTEDKILLIHTFQNLISNAWGVGGLFFGLWLFPMGYIVIRSRIMPVWLGRILLLGASGYVISTFLYYGGYDFAYIWLLTLPATVGEFWMIGYLLIFGLRE